MTPPACEYQHPQKIQDRLVELTYAGEIEYRLQRIGEVLIEMSDEGCCVWHERLLTLAAAMLLNIHAAKQHWVRSEWPSLMEFLADFDHRMEELKGMANPVSS